MNTISWLEIIQKTRALSAKVGQTCKGETLHVHGIPRGGAVVAGLLQAMWPAQYEVCAADRCDIMVDDVYDSGSTSDEFKSIRDVPQFFLIDKRDPEWAGRWIVFPWEDGDEAQGPRENVRRIIEYIGEDPNRQGLKDTPDRVIRAYGELCAGYKMDPAEILKVQFDVQADEMIVVRDIKFSSLCEHHMLPFSGSMAIAYIPAPGKGVVGISKLVRLAVCFSKRLQIQERLVVDIAEALQTALNPLGVAVIAEASHSCMACRGVLQPDARLVTSCMLGVFRNDAEVRMEFLELRRG